MTYGESTDASETFRLIVTGELHGYEHLRLSFRWEEGLLHLCAGRRRGL
jgi:hypothetical protein